MGAICAVAIRGRAGAITRCDKTDRETAAIGEPFHRIANAGRVNGAAAKARHNRAEIKHFQRCGVGVDDPMATVMPPKATTTFGPRCGPRTSAIQPATGVSHVSSAMKIENATWIEAIDQPCALFIGLTNSVQPYCRLAIM